MRKFFYILILMVFVACGANDGTNKNSTPLDIEEMEAIFLDREKPYDEELARKLTKAYVTFQQENPTDDLSAGYLWRAANVCKSYNDYEQVVNLYRTIVNDYPTYKRRIESHFLIALTYDNDLKNKDMAAKVYKEVADKYPNDKWGQDAAFMYNKIVHMTDEELNEWLNEQNKK